MGLVDGERSEEELQLPEEMFPELALWVGKSVKILATETTRRHGIFGGRGYVDSVSVDGRLRVIYMDRPLRPAGPFDLELSDIEDITSLR